MLERVHSFPQRDLHGAERNDLALQIRELAPQRFVL
jgi:hypothetical protein